MAYVYLHRRADNNIPFYVGISDNNYYRKNVLNSRSTLYKNVYKKHGRTIEIIADNISYDDAKELEMLIIDTLGRINIKTGCLVNLTEGGDGTLGHIVSKEGRKKMSLKKIGKPTWNKGKKLSKTHKEKLSKAKLNYTPWIKGKHHSEEAKLKMSKAKKGKKLNRGFVLIQYSKEGVEINRFRTTKEASEFTGLSTSSIDNCTSGLSKTSGGYIWERKKLKKEIL